MQGVKYIALCHHFLNVALNSKRTCDGKQKTAKNGEAMGIKSPIGIKSPKR
jgi:hypothetical protein